MLPMGEGTPIVQTLALIRVYKDSYPALVKS